MKHARPDYNRIQDPAISDPSLLPQGCTPIGENEPVFLLRAQDKTAAEVVRFWASLNRMRGTQPKAIRMAEEHADLMDTWPTKKRADVP